MGRIRNGVKAASQSSITIDFYYQGVRCRERIPLEPTPANLKRVEKQKAAIELAILDGTFDYATSFPKSKKAHLFKRAVGHMPLREFLPEWLEHEKKFVKASTWDGYRKMVNGPLTEMFGNYHLGELTRDVISEQLSKLEVSRKRLNNLQSCLRLALKYAIEQKLLHDNPLHRWSHQNREESETKNVEDEVDEAIDPFTAEEQVAILAAMRHPQLQHLYQFAFWTGMRTSELVALRWRDIDWIKGEVYVKRAHTRAATEDEGPKTKASVRTVKLLAPAVEALKAQKEYTFMLKDHVFHDPRYNQPFAGDQELREKFWKPALYKAGVRYRYPYQTRHTYASMMLMANEHPMWVAKQMGHKDWTMIANRYGRWIDDEATDAGSKAESKFAGKDKASDVPTGLGQHLGNIGAGSRET